MEPLSIGILLSTCLATAGQGLSILDSIYTFVKDASNAHVHIKALRDEVHSGQIILDLINTQMVHGGAVPVPRLHERLEHLLEGYLDSLKRLTDVAKQHEQKTSAGANGFRRLVGKIEFTWNREDIEKFQSELKDRATFLVLIYNLGLQPGATIQGQQEAFESLPRYSTLSFADAATDATDHDDNGSIISGVEGGDLRKEQPRSPRRHRPLFKKKHSSRGLIEAATDGDLVEMRACLHNSADVNHQSKAAIIKHGGMAPIHAAAEGGHLAAVELLLEAGADIHLVIKATQQTALHLAARHGSSTVTKALIKNGALVDAKDVYGQTPLLEACNEEIKMILLNAGSDASLRGKEALTSLHYAAAFGHTKALKLILQKPRIDADVRDNLERTPLWLACSSSMDVGQENLEQIVRALLDAGASPNAMHKLDRTTPFCMAVRGGHFSLVRMLLESERGVEVNFVLPFLTAYHAANRVESSSVELNGIHRLSVQQA